jgi:hypothetical protein
MSKLINSTNLTIGSKRISMDSAKSLSTLYDIINKMLGPVGAKKAVSTAVSLVISDLQDEGIAITPEILEKRIYDYVQDFVEASKTEVA